MQSPWPRRSLLTPPLKAFHEALYISLANSYYAYIPNVPPYIEEYAEGDDTPYIEEYPVDHHELMDAYVLVFWNLPLCD